MPRKCRAHTVTAMATEGFQEEREMQCVFSPVAVSDGQTWECCRDSTQAALPTPPPWTLRGLSEKSRNTSLGSLCCGSILCSTGTRLPLSGPNMPFCASHFNLWGLGKDNSGRIILPPFFQLWGNLVFWQLSAFASQTWLTLVLTRSLSLHLWSNFP